LTSEGKAKNIEIQEIVQGLVFIELAAQYNKFLDNNQLNEADSCLQGIARIINSIKHDN
jgi:hypothetical protein